ncbi:putative porin [Acinetobacter calcoaceticus]|uniref:Putative porin n=1 Tax=Acinetobacter calcoaceticus TaxID=471 RepID=A0A4R1XDJ9_ACICA|nr:putative porin [Acinetobacter calcoaceticus]
MYIKSRIFSLATLTFSSSLCIISSSHAEFDLISKNQFDSPLLAPLQVQFGGQLRPQWINNAGDEPNYYKNGHDGGSRVRLKMDYDLNPKTKLVGYYERGFDPFNILNLDEHHSPNALSNQQRQAYIAIQHQDWGNLSYGQQFGIYYSVIGSKSDVWDNDALAAASSNGAHASYDGSSRAKNSLMYTKENEKFKLYANILFPEKSVELSDQHRYKREHGAGIGLDYKASKDLTYSAAFSQTNATIIDAHSQPTIQEQDYQQNIIGTAITYQPNQWYLVATASHYHDFVPLAGERTVDHYFTGNGYGLEAFAGYTFKFDQPYLKSIQPYVAVDTLRLTSDQPYRSNHQYIGFTTEFNKHLKVMTEHTFASNSDDSEQDSTWVTMYISF